MDFTDLKNGEEYAVCPDSECKQKALRSRYIGSHAEGMNSKFTSRRTYAHFHVLEEDGALHDDPQILVVTYGGQVLGPWADHLLIRAAIEFLGLDQAPKTKLVGADRWEITVPEMTAIGHRLIQAGIA